MRTPFLISLLTVGSLPAADLFDGLQRLDSEFEGLFSDDIDVWSAAISYEQERNDWTISLGLTRINYDLEYSPVATLGGTALDLSENTLLGNITLAKDVSNDLQLSFGARGYDGYADYRSIWVAEYYRQNFSFPGSGYSPPDPSGWSLSAGLVWSPRIESRLNFSLNYGQDTIAPGWASPFESSNDLLESRAVSIRWEETLNPSLKTETTLSYSDITDRDPRVLIQSAWNYAISDDLTLRAQMGAGRENPDFESIYGGLSLDYQLTDQWSVALSSRLYHDSGEIENSGFNTAAPGLQSVETGLSVLYQKGDHSLRASLSYYHTDYDTVDPSNDFFANLYQDRDWIAMRLAYSLNF
ncbi:hypothetical protein OAG86_03085 [Akkermansiaceae bacterium]|nr:hypothetical protein [Akkermansiaceae bacterium]MDB4597248.1 hypothetical protein [Akkermansiaceae bacterium]MDC1206600.1 hypothetical protein [Akkermansiaceae bacterium]